MAVSTMHGILKDNGLGPHQVKTFRVSRDLRFELKVRDVVGLYVDPPDHAVVIPAGEKPRIQALGRTQRPLPMKPGAAGTRTHDYKRNGATCLWQRSTSPPEGRRPDGRTAPPGGVPRLPRPRRRADRARSAGPCRPGRRLLAQIGQGPCMAEAPSRPDVPLHAGPGLVDERRRRVLLQALEAEAEGRDLRLARRVHRGDRGLHRTPQRQRCPSVPLEQETRGAGRLVEKRAPEAAGNGIK